MNDTVWLQSNATALINTAHISMMAATVEKDRVVINMWLGDKSTVPIPIAILKSAKAATKFMKTVGEHIKQNKKFIDTGLLAEQCNADPESDV